MSDSYDGGMRVRREVLGDAHVDRAIAATTPFTAPFQEFITRSAWGSVWTRDGLDRRTRSCITLALLTALGHHEEARDARTRGAAQRAERRGDRRGAPPHRGLCGRAGVQQRLQDRSAGARGRGEAVTETDLPALRDTAAAIERDLAMARV